MKSIIFFYSYHHNNTLKICNTIGSKLNSIIINIDKDNEIKKIDNYDLIGFGAGIDSGKHYPKFIEQFFIVSEDTKYSFLIHFIAVVKYIPFAI